MRLGAQRDAVVSVAQRLVADGLVVGTAGNISVRSDAHVAVTPTGIGYDRLVAAHVGVHALDGTAVDAPLSPTSEFPLHLAVYAARPEAGAIVHTHSVAATALSCLVPVIPAVHYYVALFGGAPRVAPYVEYGTEALAAGAVSALEGRTACLLGNHGSVVLGDTLEQAYERTRTLEWLCEIALRVMSSGLMPRLLDGVEQDSAAARLADYGQPGR